MAVITRIQNLDKLIKTAQNLCDQETVNPVDIAAARIAKAALLNSEDLKWCKAESYRRLASSVKRDSEKWLIDTTIGKVNEAVAELDQKFGIADSKLPTRIAALAFVVFALLLPRFIRF